FNANSAGEASEKLRLLARNYSVIFITEDLAVQIAEQIEKFRSRTYPAIIPIPSSKGATGYGIENIKKDVEKAVGTDILFNE
ncbi:MAG: V-type ATP synthase subunit F, partial [Clostridia bacterium]|nr:V-type ATP synthase subunit F [Clostridia bacterium]